MSREEGMGYIPEYNREKNPVPRFSRKWLFSG
jgi:hypothetical protein